MMLRYTFDREDVAQRIEDAVKKVLAQGLRTGDICDRRHAESVVQRDGRRGGGGAVKLNAERELSSKLHLR